VLRLHLAEQTHEKLLDDASDFINALTLSFFLPNQLSIHNNSPELRRPHRVRLQVSISSHLIRQEAKRNRNSFPSRAKLHTIEHNGRRHNRRDLQFENITRVEDPVHSDDKVHVETTLPARDRSHVSHCCLKSPSTLSVLHPINLCNPVKYSTQAFCSFSSTTYAPQALSI
jgi:hypothetical protein